MRLLVTGGAGFIGANFIHWMLAKYPHYKIINLDKLTYAGNLDNLKDVENNPNYKFVRGDICDQSLVSSLTKDVDVVVNFAAETHVDRSIVDAEDFLKTNIYGVSRLLEITKKQAKKFIQISTDEVYGSIQEGSFTEESPLRPNSSYAASKASADLLVRAYFVTYGVPAIITRSSNNFGPYQYPEKVIPLFITNALCAKALPLYGDGLNIRDWLYVIDNCEAIDLVLHKGRLGEVYNIAGGNELPNIELTKLILENLGKSEQLIMPVKDRLGHDRRYSLDCQKIKSEIGWQPRHEFKKALQETIQWYKDNQWWWQNLKPQISQKETTD